MSDTDKKHPDHLYEDQDKVGGTDRPPFAEQQKDTGEPGGDITEEESKGESEAG